MTNFINLAPVKETTIKGDDFLIFDSLEFRNQSTNNEQITKWTTTRGGDRKSIDYILTIVIHLYTQPLNNRPVKRYEIIFRHVREDFIDITTRARMSWKTYCMRLNLKKWFCMSIKRENVILITRFCQSIKRKIKKQIPLFGGIKLMHYSFFMHNKSPWRQGVNNLSYTKYAPIITITKKISFFIIHLPNLILHAVFTQPEKDSLSFFTCWLICSNKSSSKRICFIVLFERSKSFFSFFTCTGSYHCDKLGCKGSYHYISNYLKKTIPRSATNTIEGSNQTIKQEVMIMANRYDSAPLRAEQSKLFKFYDLSTAQVIQTTATTEREARKSLGKQSLIFIARIRLTPIIERARTWGDYSHE